MQHAAEFIPHMYSEWKHITWTINAQCIDNKYVLLSTISTTRHVAKIIITLSSMSIFNRYPRMFECLHYHVCKIQSPSCFNNQKMLKIIHKMQIQYQHWLNNKWWTLSGPPNWIIFDSFYFIQNVISSINATVIDEFNFR